MAEKPEDLNLPNAVVARLVKEALPDGVSIAKDARTAISKAASVFILYATSCANNFALKGKRKTISAHDVLKAMEEMEFNHLLDPLQQSLDAYRKACSSKKVAAADRRKKDVAPQVDAGSDPQQPFSFLQDDNMGDFILVDNEKSDGEDEENSLE